jgi:RND family efflux transporter MFP subunit
MKKISSRILLPMMAIVLVSACGSESKEPVSEEKVVRPVKLVRIMASQNTKTREYPAVISAAQTSEIAFQVSGRLQELNIKESQQVKKGDILGKLETRDLTNQLNSLKSQYENAKTEYDRAANLLKEDAIAKTVVDQRKTQMDVFKTQLDSANKSLNDATLRAPFDGVIAAIHAENYQNIQAQEKIITLISGDRLEATINVPASVVSQLPKQENQASFVSFQSEPLKLIEARFVEASLQADATTQTYKVSFEFESPKDLLILPGMNGTITTQSNSKVDSERNIGVQVPLASIQSSEGSKYVWLVNSNDMTVSKQVVVIANSIGETVNVVGGLKLGDIIVGAGAAYLADGMEVKEWKVK